jgi:hypothetical protein
MELVIKGVTYMICTRVVPSKKPLLFLLKLEPDNSRKYISSLYPTSDLNKFNFDYSCKSYTLDILVKEITLRK